MMRPRAIFRILAAAIVPVLAAAMALGEPQAQSNSADRYKKEIKRLEEGIAKSQRELDALKKEKGAASKRVAALDRKIEQRSALINETSRRMETLGRAVEESERRTQALTDTLTRLERGNREAVRAAWRNYRMRNTTTYILSSESFAEAARRIASLRAAGEHNIARMHTIAQVREQVQREQEELARQRTELAEERSRLDSERKQMRTDVKSLRADVNRLTTKEKKVLKAKKAQEAELKAAARELQKLSKGNRVGGKFSRSTRGLNIPLAGGRMGNNSGEMAEFVGKAGAVVRTVFEGKVLDVKRNRINNKWEVYIAHGEYITVYSELASTTVQKGQSVVRDQQIGTAGESLDILTQRSEGRIRFIAVSPDVNERLRAADFFRK